MSNVFINLYFINAYTNPTLQNRISDIISTYLSLTYYALYYTYTSYIYIYIYLLHGDSTHSMMECAVIYIYSILYYIYYLCLLSILLLFKVIPCSCSLVIPRNVIDVLTYYLL